MVKDIIAKTLIETTKQTNILTKSTPTFIFQLLVGKTSHYSNTVCFKCESLTIVPP